MSKLEITKSLVRPIITYAFAGAFIYLTIAGTIKPDTFLATAGTVIGFWFHERATRK